MDERHRVDVRHPIGSGGRTRSRVSRRRPAVGGGFVAWTVSGVARLAGVTPDLRSPSSRDAQDLIGAMYSELHQLARRHLVGERGHTLQPTALVNEAFVKLAGYHGGAIHDRAHFAALVSRVMRQILVDHARSKLAERNGGGREPVSIMSRAEATRQWRMTRAWLAQRLRQATPP